ncbi:DUF4179 domain-containing protein [Clostridium butyricum]|uniref:DUF4179 domain-containing protein n=1 Tax=Clostridium butyricum TaxID=1492 RepID=UPI0022E20648|nr:DUF4179 domain-containing protein [Clostridium butyricum]
MKWKSLLDILFKNNKKYKILIITLIFILLVGIVCKGNIKKIPVICDIFSNGKNINLEQYDDYLEVVGKSKEYGDITVTLEYAVADKNILMLSFLVKNDGEEIKDLKDADIHISSLSINGKEVHLISKNNLELLDDNQVRIVKRISLNYDDLPSNLNISIGIEKMFNKDGNWDIKFNVDTAKILKETYREKINSSINTRDLKGKVKEVTISPLTIKIDTAYKSYNKSRLEFLVLDEDDNELTMVGENTSTNLNQSEYNAKYVSNAPLQKLKVIPIYYGKANREETLISNKVNLEEFHPFYLKISDNLAIKIEDYMIKDNYIILKYNYEYMGKVIKKDLNSLFIKYDDIIYDDVNSEEGDNIKRNHARDECKVAVFKYNNQKYFEIGCYDGSNSLLLEDYIFEVEKNKD